MEIYLYLGIAVSSNTIWTRCSVGCNAIRIVGLSAAGVVVQRSCPGTSRMQSADLSAVFLLLKSVVATHILRGTHMGSKRGGAERCLFPVSYIRCGAGEVYYCWQIWISAIERGLSRHMLHYQSFVKRSRRRQDGGACEKGR